MSCWATALAIAAAVRAFRVVHLDGDDGRVRADVVEICLRSSVGEVGQPQLGDDLLRQLLGLDRRGVGWAICCALCSWFTSVTFPAGPARR